MPTELTSISLTDPSTIVGIVVALGLLRTLVMRAVNAARRPQLDPQRLFDGPQKTIGRRRSGNRCEHKHPLWFRCKGGADEADHIYPWSRGGATSVSNLQYLCKPHNRRKSAWVPTRTYIWRLERRRRSYFPPGEDLKVEWRQGIGPPPRSGDIDLVEGAEPVSRPRPNKPKSGGRSTPSGFYTGIDRGTGNG